MEFVRCLPNLPHLLPLLKASPSEAEMTRTVSASHFLSGRNAFPSFSTTLVDLQQHFAGINLQSRRLNPSKQPRIVEHDAVIIDREHRFKIHFQRFELVVLDPVNAPEIRVALA